MPTAKSDLEPTLQATSAGYPSQADLDARLAAARGDNPPRQLGPLPIPPPGNP